MPKYQIILSSAEQIPDDEFREMVHSWFAAQNTDSSSVKFNVVYARNLEGVREEVWNIAEQIKENIKENDHFVTTTEINETFKEIQNLFQLD